MWQLFFCVPPRFSYIAQHRLYADRSRLLLWTAQRFILSQEKLFYHAALLIKIHLTSWNGVEWKSWMNIFTSLNTFAVPIRAQHLTKAICQVNIVGGKSQGEMCISLFPFGSITMTDDYRILGKDFNRAKMQLRVHQSEEEKQWLPPRQTNSGFRGATCFVQREIDFQGV